MKLLIVDDEATYRKKVIGFLKRETGVQLQFLEAETVQEAKAKLEGCDFETSVALVDLFLKNNEAGFSVIEFIRVKYPWVVSVVVSGVEADFQKATQAFEAGAFDYYRKSEALEKLTQMVTNALHEHRKRLGLYLLHDQLRLANVLEISRRLKDEDRKPQLGP